MILAVYMSRIETVFGPISPEELKLTLPHEHLVCTYTVWHTGGDEASKQALFDAPVTLANRGKIVRDGGVSRTNLTMLEWEEAAEELLEFKRMGGNSLVELTTVGAGRDPLALQKISKATGINIVCPTGFYIWPSHPPFVKSMNVNAVRDMIVKELTEGLTYLQPVTGIPTKIEQGVPTDIKAGIIKCATLYPISPDEEKVFRGAARAQKATGAPFTIHPTLLDLVKKKKVFELEHIIQMIQEEGANLEKFYMSHSDLTCSDDRSRVNTEYHKKLLDKYPCVLEYDTFGNETWWSYWPGSLFISDNERCLALTELCESGYEKQIMISQDTFTKVQRAKYGGWGYCHILKHIVPRLKYMGVSQKQINTMMIDNPKRMLAY
jgi:phosphotriesterase-related protein